MAIRFKPRPRSRRPRFGGGGSPSKRTRGGSMNRLRKKEKKSEKEEKPDYASRLPRPTMPEAKSVASEKRVVEEKVTPERIMPTRPAPVEEPQVSTETRAQPGRMPQEELSRKPPVNLDEPIQDPFTIKPSSIEIPSGDVNVNPGYTPVSDYGASSSFGEPDPPKPPPIEPPKQRQQVGTLPFITSGSRLLPLVTEDNQPSTLPAPAGFGLPVEPQDFVDPFNLPKEDPSKVRAFGIRKADGSFFSPEETRDLLSRFSPEELKALFGEAAITNVLLDR